MKFGTPQKNLCNDLAPACFHFQNGPMCSWCKLCRLTNIQILLTNRQIIWPGPLSSAPTGALCSGKLQLFYNFFSWPKVVSFVAQHVPFQKLGSVLIFLFHLKGQDQVPNENRCFFYTHCGKGRTGNEDDSLHCPVRWWEFECLQLTNYTTTTMCQHFNSLIIRLSRMI